MRKTSRTEGSVQGQRHHHNRLNEVDETWDLKPSVDQEHNLIQTDLSPPSFPSTSSATESRIEPISAILPVSSHTVKPKFVKKYDQLGSSNNEVGSLNSMDSDIGLLSIQEQKVNKKQDKDGDEEEEGGEGQERDWRETIEESESVEDVDGILREFQLGVEEPELSEEQLRNNDQLQGYEVLNSNLLMVKR